jgi:hypothetical protein
MLLEEMAGLAFAGALSWAGSSVGRGAVGACFSVLRPHVVQKYLE